MMRRLRSWVCAAALLGTLLGCKSGPAQEVEAVSAEVTKIKTPRIESKVVKYQAGDVSLTGYLAWDVNKTGPRPGVLVVHEWWGHEEYAQKRARMLAEMGYTGLALDMYGDGKRAMHPDDAKKFKMEVVSNMDLAKARFTAAQELLEAHETTDPTKTGAIGYCFGGEIVLHMARFGMPLKGVASFHGSLGTQSPAKPGAIQAKILVAHGEADPFVSAEDLAGFHAEMKAAGADLKFIGYPGVKHSFTNPSSTEKGEKFGLPLEYNKEADEASWQALKTFLADVFDDRTAPTPEAQ